MGWAARAKQQSLTPEEIKERAIKRNTIPNPFEQRVKVHIPNSTLDLADGLFMGMLKGLRPMTSEERAEAEAQGMDLRPPDIVKKERELIEKFGIEKTRHTPEVEIILTDKD